MVFSNPLDFWHDWEFHILVLSTVLIAAAGNVINDYFDIKIDRINKPHKVWIGKIISRRHAQFLHQILSGTAILLGLLISYKVFIINIFSVTLLWFYASGLKKRPFIGNFVIALLTALVIAEIALVYDTQNKLIYMYAVFALFINLIREIIKDMEDMKGDSQHRAKTLPLIYGIHKTKKVLYLLMGLFLASMFFFVFKVQDAKIYIFASALIVLWFVLVVGIYKSDRKKHFGNLSNLCKWIIIIGMASIILFNF